MCLCVYVYVYEREREREGERARERDKREVGPSHCPSMPLNGSGLVKQTFSNVFKQHISHIQYFSLCLRDYEQS